MLEIFKDVDQGSDEWKALRCGVLTASNFKDMLAKGEGKMRNALLRRLAGEIITGVPEETFKSPEMGRGNEMEDAARKAYSLVTGYEPQRIGFCKNHDVGYSPDSFINDDGLLEVKTSKPSVLIELMKTCPNGGDKISFPALYLAQCTGGLWVTGREWIDLVVYWPGMPMFERRLYRDEAPIEYVKSAVADFLTELAMLVEFIKGAK